MQPLTIRRPSREAPAKTADAIDLLVDCHGRIRHFTELAERLLDAKDAPDELLADAARQLARYFGVALPLHVADEDVSIAHRLRPFGKPADVEQALLEMTHQHERMDGHLDVLVPAWQRIAADVSALARERGVIAPRTRALAVLMAPHLAMEEATIFPWIRRTIDPETLATITAELRARRGGAEHFAFDASEVRRG